jgi:hypothetical protein
MMLQGNLGFFRHRNLNYLSGLSQDTKRQADLWSLMGDATTSLAGERAARHDQL